MKILIIGGNRFFGRRLAVLLVDAGHEVTLLNRGSKDDGLGDRVHRLKADRDNHIQMVEAIGESKWDVVVDQVAFDYEQAESVCELFRGRTKRFVFTSTQSVYEAGSDISESAFVPESHQFAERVAREKDYGEAKRQAEVAFHRTASFPICFARLPIVIGEDDYTGRFKWHLDKLVNEKEMFFPNHEAQISFVTAEFAATALKWLVESDFTGPINIASSNPIKLNDFVGLLATYTGKKPIYSSEASQENHSPYGISESWFMNCSVLNSNGLRSAEIIDWLPVLLDNHFKSYQVGAQ